MASLWNKVTSTLSGLANRQLSSAHFQREIDTFQLFLLSAYRTAVTDAVARQLKERYDDKREVMDKLSYDGFMKFARSVRQTGEESAISAAEEHKRQVEQAAAASSAPSATEATSAQAPQAAQASSSAASTADDSTGEPRLPPEGKSQVIWQGKRLTVDFNFVDERHLQLSYRQQSVIVDQHLDEQVANMLWNVHYQRMAMLGRERSVRLPPNYRSLPFTLAVKPSRIPHDYAGEGVFLHGHALPGDVVALYPGTVYLSHELRDIPNFPNISDGNPFLMSRYDYSVIDAQHWEHRFDRSHRRRLAQSAFSHISTGQSEGSTDGYEADSDTAGSPDAAQSSPVASSLFKIRSITGAEVAPPASRASASAGKADGGEDGSVNEFYQRKRRELQQIGLTAAPGGLTDTDTEQAYLSYAVKHPRQSIGRRTNPYAIAHKVNHPGVGLRPNVMAANYNYKMSLPAALRAFVPNACCNPTSMAHLLTPDVLVRGVVLVATENIHEDTELLWNYRYNPNIQTPDWYVPVDLEEDERRWAR